jgi:hypothetical protein
MKVILTFTVPSETRDEAMARFLETGGRPPRSHAARALDPARSLRWVFLLDSEDARSLTAFGHGWSNLLKLTMGPVLEDQELSEAPQRARHQSASAEVRAADAPAETYPEDSPVVPETRPGTTKPPYEEIA